MEIDQLTNRNAITGVVLDHLVDQAFRKVETPMTILEPFQVCGVFACMHCSLCIHVETLADINAQRCSNS